MIKVTYHPIDSDATTSSSATLADWFIQQFGDEINVPAGLRITCGNANRENDVTEEIALGDPNGHLTAVDGEYHVVVVPAGPETWVPLIVSLVVSVAAVLLTPKPDVPSAANRRARHVSATNSLGNRSNEAKPGDRFQDVRGFEPSVYADLLMEPHRRYTDNREIEFVYGTVTAGKGLVSEPRDGITKWEVVEGSQLDIYPPGAEPGNGSPSQTFGASTITFPIVASTRSRNVTGQILPPPNQLTASSDGTIGPFGIPEGSSSGWLNLLAQNGIRLSGQSDSSYSVTCQFTVYELDSNGERTGEKSVLPDIVLKSNPVLLTDQVGVTQDFDIPYQRAEILGKRISNTDKDFEGTVVDEVQWAAMYTVEPTPVTTPSDVTTAYATIKQTPAALGVQERKLNFGVTRYERRYLGNGQMSTELDTPSAEFADAVVGLALDPTVGKNVTLEQLNVDSLYAVQEEIVAYFGTRDAVKFGYSFSTTDMTFEDHLTLIGRAVFCKVFRVGNTYEFRFNRPRAKGETALLLNHRTKYAGTDKRNRRFTDPDSKGYDGVVISYKDAKTKVFENIRIPEGTFPVNPYEIELTGVTNEQVATWHALREWNRIKYRRVFHETEAHSFARGLVPDDRITMANDTLTRSQNGNVLAQSGLELRLAEGVNVVAGEQYTITLLYKSGTVENILCEKGTIGPAWVRLFSLPSEDVYTGNLEMRTAYNLYVDEDAEKDDMLVEAMTVSIKNGQERVRVQAVNYDVRYWDGDPQTVSTGSFSTAFSDAFDKG